VKEIVIVMVVR